MNFKAQKGPSMTHHNSLAPLLTATRDDLRSRRAARASRKTLERELASYTTTADQHELDAILDRADPAAAEEIRLIIHRSRITSRNAGSTLSSALRP